MIDCSVKVDQMVSDVTGSKTRGSEMRELRSELVNAEDAKIHRVLELIDSLAKRDDADAVIAPLRQRLAKLKPRRKVNFARLLFAPFNPLIVPPSDWNRESSNIPRTALGTLARYVQINLSEAAGSSSIVTSDVFADDLTSLLRAGGKVWPAAAEALRSLTAIPRDWSSETGLPDRDFTAISAALQVLFPLATPLIQTVVDARAGTDPEPERLLEMLGATAPAGARVAAMFIAMCLSWLPRPGAFIKLADQFASTKEHAAIAATADKAVELVLSGIERSSTFKADLVSSADEMRRVAVLLDDLISNSANRPGRRTRVEKVRQSVDIVCRENFAAEIGSRLVTPCSKIATADEGAIEAFENTARTLRRYETVARKFGGAEFYDQQMLGATQALTPRRDETAMARVSRLRLIEILRGSDAAAAAMQGLS
jgi:hypothetical protein